MNFKELKDALYWACDNGQNADDLAFLAGGNDGRLINQALRDLADCLRIVKYDNTIQYDSAGKIALPADLLEVLRLRWGNYTDLTPVDDAMKINTLAEGVSAFYVVGRSSAQLYGAPTPIPSGLAVTPEGTTGTTTWGYRITAIARGLESIACAEVKTAAGSDVLSATNYNHLSWNAVPGADGYSVYRTTAGGTPDTTGYVATIGVASYDDIGASAGGSAITNRLLHLWYRAYPAELAADSDVPSDVPPEYHDALATIYAKAQFVRKVGDYAQYQQLMGMWWAIKKEIRGVLEVRSDPPCYAREWRW